MYTLMAIPFPEEIGTLFFNHLTLGGGIPSTGHSNKMVLLSTTRGLSTRFASSILGGTEDEMKCIVIKIEMVKDKDVSKF